MLNWLWENLPKLLGVAGFGLAVFNQWSIWRDRRERKASEAPRGRLRRIEPHSSGEVALTALFTNTRHCRLLLKNAWIVSPKGYGLVIASHSDEGLRAEPQRSVTMSWSVMSADEHEGRTQGRFFAVPLPGSSAGGSATAGEAIRWEIVFKGEEISPKRRPITITVIHVAKADDTTRAAPAPRSKVRSRPWIDIRGSDWFSRR